MKNVFGYPYSKTEDMPCDGARFITNRADAALKKEIDDVFGKALETNSKANLPGWLKTLKLICYVGAIIVAFSLLRNLGELTLAEMYGNAPAIFYGGGVCLVLWAVLFCVEKLKYKKVDDSGEIDKALESMEELNLRSEEQLGIPHDHKKVDVLSFRYTEKNGKIKIKEELFYKHMNNEMKLFRNGDDLCLADIDSVYSFPINDIKKYVLKKKKANMDEWNKDVPFNKGEYKQYKITSNDYGTIFCRYYAMQISDVFGEYELFFPEYELAQFKAIADAPVEKE